MLLRIARGSAAEIRSKTGQKADNGSEYLLGQNVLAVIRDLGRCIEKHPRQAVYALFIGGCHSPADPWLQGARPTRCNAVVGIGRPAGAQRQRGNGSAAA